AKIDRRNFSHVYGRPHGVDARNGARSGDGDRTNHGVRVRRAHDTHVELMRKGDVGRERAAAGDEREILEPPDRAAAEPGFHVADEPLSPLPGGERSILAEGEDRVRGLRSAVSKKIRSPSPHPSPLWGEGVDCGPLRIKYGRLDP